MASSLNKLTDINVSSEVETVLQCVQSTDSPTLYSQDLARPTVTDLQTLRPISYSHLVLMGEDSTQYITVLVQY